MKKIFALFYLMPFFTISQTLNDGLIGHWSFNGNALEANSNGNDGVVIGAILTNDREGYPFSAYEFDGTDDRINSISLQQSQIMTTSIWFKPNISHTGQLINTGSTHNLVIEATSNSKIEAWLWLPTVGKQGLVVSNGTYIVDEWNHVTYVYNYSAGSTEMYLNGIKVGTGTTTTNPEMNQSEIVIGMHWGQTIKPFNGALDDVRFYNRALSENEIQLLSSSYTRQLCESLYCVGGNVGIGTMDTKGHKLAVAGDIIAEEVKISLQENWPDFVFRENYSLPSIEEVEAHINTKGHLCGIPTEIEVTRDGYNLGDMDAKLLQKIEELTLYLIKQNKQIQELREKVDQLEKHQE